MYGEYVLDQLTLVPARIDSNGAAPLLQIKVQHPDASRIATAPKTEGRLRACQYVIAAFCLTRI